MKYVVTCGGSVLSSESHASVILAVSLAMMSSFCKSLRARPCLIILSQNFSSCSIFGIGDTDLSPAATYCNVLACIHAVQRSSAKCASKVCQLTGYRIANAYQRYRAIASAYSASHSASTVRSVYSSVPQLQ
jgi:hypothetical protein